jgi:hypothetical protein
MLTSIEPVIVLLAGNHHLQDSQIALDVFLGYGYDTEFETIILKCMVYILIC